MADNNSTNLNRRDYLFLSASFLASAALALVLAMAVGLAPFGDKILIFSDSKSQYTSFWSYFRQLFTKEADPLYSLEMTLGGSPTGLLSYYCSSPLNLIFLLFPQEKLPLAVHLCALIKLGLCGLTMGIYMRHCYGSSMKNLIFTLSYTFCAFNISFCWCLMWLDGVLLLPLIALGLRYLYENQRPLLYILSLGAAILLNYYIGFILCGFSVLFYLYLLLGQGKGFSAKNFGLYAAGSVGAALIGAAALLPAAAAMGDSKTVPFSLIAEARIQNTRDILSNILFKFLPENSAAAQSISAHILPITLIFLLAALIIVIWICRKSSVKKGIRVFLAAAFITVLLCYGAVYESGGFFAHKLLSGACSYENMLNGYPGLYSGMTVLVLSLFFFIFSGTDKKEKRAALTVSLILLFSMHFELLNCVWHGFTHNNWFNCRYSFVFSFFLIIFAARGLEHAEEFSLKHGLFILGFAAAALLLSRLMSSEPVSVTGAAIILAVTALLCLLIGLSGKLPKAKRLRTVFLAVLTAAELFTNTLISWKSFTADSSYSEYYSTETAGMALTEGLKRADGGLYRCSITQGVNDPMRFNYKGLSHYSSNESAGAVRFLSAQGLANSDPVWASRAYGGCGAIDSLYGIKYVSEPQDKEFYCEFSQGIFINPLAFPIAFMADSSVLTASAIGGNVFENINSCYAAIAPGVGQKVFCEPAEISFEPVNLQGNAQEGYSLADPQKKGEIIYTVKAAVTGPLYCYNNELSSNGSLSLRGEKLTDFLETYDWRLHYIDMLRSGESLKLSYTLEPGSDKKIKPSLSLYSENKDAIGACSAIVSERPCRTALLKDSHWLISADAGAEGSCLMLTIPQDEGWRVSVDGKAVQSEKALGLLLAVPLEEGTHQVELRFIPPGLTAGITISALSLGAVLITGLIRRRRRTGRVGK